MIKDSVIITLIREEHPKILISDREFKEDYMPNTEHVYCWNHIRQNVEFHARDKLKMNEDDRRRVNNDLSAMLRSSSVENYEKRKEEFFAMDHWRPQLRDYFERRVNNDIIERAGTNIIIHFYHKSKMYVMSFNDYLNYFIFCLAHYIHR